MAEDATSETIVRNCLAQLDADAAAAATSYEDALYRLQAFLVALKQEDPEAAPTPEAAQAVSHALGHLHPSADDHLVGHGERLRRLLACVDVELSRWTSGMAQPPGPSGATAVAPRPPEAVA
jgi:hypothetical protein